MDERKPPERNQSASATGEWRVDPRDVQLHRRRLAEAKRVGPLGKLARWAGVLALVVGAALVYLNFDTLRGITVQVPFVNSLLEGEVIPGVPLAPDEHRNVVEAPAVVGDALPTSVGEQDPQETPAPGAAPEPAPPAADARAAVEEPPPPPRPPEPEAPVAPETFDFGIETVSASEADASVAVLVLRNGGRRGVSAVTWWTSDGTAKAGMDYGSLGRQVVRFSTGEQNRSVRIPLVGDKAAEGPETFYVHLAPGEHGTNEVAKVEVIINDDD